MSLLPQANNAHYITFCTVFLNTPFHYKNDLLFRCQAKQGRHFAISEEGLGVRAKVHIYYLRIKKGSPELLDILY